jgi:hypothetical protein
MQLLMTSLMDEGPGCFSTKTRAFLSPWISMPFSVALKYLSHAMGVRNLTTAQSAPGAGRAMESSLPPHTRAWSSLMLFTPETPFRIHAR